MAQKKTEEFSYPDQFISDVSIALSHPGRISIIRIIARKPGITTGELVEFLPFTQSTVSHHLKELIKTELISVSIDGKRSLYTLNENMWSRFARHYGRLVEELGIQDSQEAEPEQH